MSHAETWKWAARPEDTLNTFRRIASFFRLLTGVNVQGQDIRQANPGVSEPIPTATVLKIPKVRSALCPEDNIHTVSSTESMFIIARDNNVTLEALIEANPQIPNSRVIYPGEWICIPKEEKIDDSWRWGARPEDNLDTFKRIAQFFRKITGADVRARDIRRANPNVSEPIPTATTLKIPKVRSALCPGDNIHRVAPSQSMFIIARDNNVTLEALIKANPQIPNPKLIYPREWICVPKKKKGRPKKPR